MAKPLNVYILTYPDNPISHIFLDVFLKNNIQVKGVVVEEKKGSKNRQRFKKKIGKDGILRAVYRAFQVYMMKVRKKTIVDLAKKHHIQVDKVSKFNSKACENILSQLDIDLFAIASAFSFWASELPSKLSLFIVISGTNNELKNSSLTL